MRQRTLPLQWWLYELRRRHVFRVTGGYVVAFWVVLQVADVVLPALQAPDWFMPLLIVLGIAGIPVTAVASYVWDITPEGVRRTDELGAAHETPPSVAPRWIDYLIIAALLVVLAFVLFNRPAPSPPALGNSVAILPFSDLSEDQSSRHLADGIAEAVMDRLTRAPDIVVTARTSSYAMRDSDLDAREIAQRLDVDALLEGSIQRAGDRIRINARLIDGRRGNQVWSQRYDAPVAEVFEVQDEISQAIAEVMQVQLLTIGGSALETQSTEAYDLYLRARSDLRVAGTDEALLRAIDRFERAIALDPGFAPAAAGLCRALWERYEWTRDPDTVQPATEQCEATRARFPDSVETRIALGELRLGTGQPAEAERSFRDALAREPNNAEAYSGLARALREQGRLEEGEEAIRAAIALDPAYWRYRRELGINKTYQGELAEAIESLSVAARLEPESPETLYSLGAAHFLNEDFLLAGDAFERSIRIEPNARAYANAGTNYFIGREFSRAEAMFRRATELAPDDYRWTGFLAWALREQGDRHEEAARWHRATVEAAADRLAINQADDEAMAAQAIHLAALGDREAAKRALESLPAVDEMNDNALVETAFAYLYLDRTEQSAELFRTALDRGVPMFLFENEPRLDGAWNDPVFAAIIRSASSPSPTPEENPS